MYSKSRSDKNKWTLVLLMLAGIVLGGFIGFYASQVEYLEWLDFGRAFGIDTPFTLELGILRLTLGFTIKMNIAGIIGMLAAVFVYKKVL